MAIPTSYYRYKGETYCLTRLGFGISSAPRIMASILKYVLAKSDTIQASTKSHVDDILVKTSQVTADVNCSPELVWPSYQAA